MKAQDKRTQNAFKLSEFEKRISAMFKNHEEDKRGYQAIVYPDHVENIKRLHPNWDWSKPIPYESLSKEFLQSINRNFE